MNNQIIGLLLTLGFYLILLAIHRYGPGINPRLDGMAKSICEFPFKAIFALFTGAFCLIWLAGVAIAHLLAMLIHIPLMFFKSLKN